MLNVFEHVVKDEFVGTLINRCTFQNCTPINDTILPNGSKLMYYENYNECSDGNGYSIVNVAGSYVEERPDYFIILTPRDTFYFIIKRDRL